MTDNRRLPHGQTLRNDFPVLHFGEVPEFNSEKWDFSVTGLVENRIKFGYEEFLALPSVEITTDFHCVTGWSQFDMRWKGVLFRTIASIASPLKEARFVSIVAEHSYTTNITLETAMDDDVIFAYEYNRSPLTLEHGYPIRLIVPKRYAYKSAKWVRGIDFLSIDKPGFWEVRGYSNSADPWKEERFA